MKHIACENPPSQYDRFLASMIEVTARDIQVEDELQRFYNKASLDAQELLQRETRCVSWVQMPYTPGNRVAYVDPAIWDTDRQVQNGYVVGQHLPLVEAERRPYSESNGLTSIFAYYFAASRSILSRM